MSQDLNSGEIEIKAEKHSDGRITSGKIETKNVWTTASDLAVKNRGYLEVRATMPAKVGLATRLGNPLESSISLGIKYSRWNQEFLLESSGSLGIKYFHWNQVFLR